jgi:hypothetical protein
MVAMAMATQRSGSIPAHDLLQIPGPKIPERDQLRRSNV